jgi:hypothetical protein
MKCRFCSNELNKIFVDLGSSPPSNSFLTFDELVLPEYFYPLKTFVCDNCYLVQIDEYAKHDNIFNSNYAYFSSFSTSWLAHAKSYTEEMVKKFILNKNSLVVEIASNDGYLLQYFKEKNIPILGIEPTSNTAEVAIKKGIPTIVEFFGVELANELKKKNIRPNLLIGNNVLAHVPDINDFVAGMKILLNDVGIITVEFPHLLQLIQNNQFDTIYHEHFSYLSLITVKQIFDKHNLTIFDVEEITTHGGSLRVYAKHKQNNQIKIEESVQLCINKEIQYKLNNIESYTKFQEDIEKLKNSLLDFLIKCSKDNKIVVGYGAAAKGNTLLNYCGIRKDLIKFVVDASPHKVGKYLPGVHIPILDENEIKKIKPDYIIILPWNLRNEISEQLNYIYEWDSKFVVAIPNLEIF